MTKAKKLLIDFETQSLLPIYKALYTSSPDTRILCMSWGFQGGEGFLWWPGQPCPQEIRDHIEAGGLIGASYAEFDQDIWDFIAVEDHDFPVTKQTQWFCTQAQTRVAGLPSALDKAARALGGRQRKDSHGRTLINRCCIPPFSEDPQDYADLGAYCLQDWVVMDDVARQIPELTPVALEDYHFNTRMNQRGIKIDRALAQAAANYAEQERGEINEKILEVTCGAVEKSTQSQRFRNWLKDCLEDDGNPDAIALMVKHVKGEKKYSVDKTVRANILAASDSGDLHLPGGIKEALTLMDDAGGSATSKFSKMLQISHPDDDRVRHAVRYAGAAATQRFCVTEDTLINVLTPVGVQKEVPITEVDVCDLVWDGVEYVAHEGVVFSGHKEVIEYEGITATPAHRVVTEEGATKRLSDAYACGDRIKIADRPNKNRVNLNRCDTSCPECKHSVDLSLQVRS